jgi:hypothetical protein
VTKAKTGVENHEKRQCRNVRGTFDAKRHTIHFMGPNIGKEQSEIKIEEIEGSCKMRFVDNLERALDPQDIVDISLTDLLQLN